MHQQHNQNMSMTDSGEIRNAAGLPDETRYIMPPDEGAMQNNAGMSGNSGYNYNGQSCVSGNGQMLGGNMMNGSGMGTNPGMMPMPIMGGMGGSQMSNMSSGHAQSQRMKNPVDMESTHAPSDNRQAYQASLRSLLHRNIGYFVVCTFLVGTQGSVTWQGILHTVGSDYFVLYQPEYERYISCDLYSLRFAQFHDAKSTPYCAASQTWQGQGNW